MVIAPPMTLSLIVKVKQMAANVQLKPKVVTHGDLEVYQKAFRAAMQVFEISKVFPKE